MPHKVMFVSGAASGLGRLTVERALADKWKVAAIDLNTEGLKGLENGNHLLLIELDVTDSDAVGAAVERCEAELGPIDRLVNAAAIMPLGPLSEQPGRLIKRITEINYFGLVNHVSAVLPKMLERNTGEIVSYCSMAGHWPLFYMGAYNASKAAVAAYTEVLYEETRKSGVRVVCVCPPIVATPLLKQADDTVRPKVFDVFPPITPEVVLDKIDNVLAGKGLWVFPGPFTRGSWLGRRFTPRLLWAWARRTESL